MHTYSEIKKFIKSDTSLLPTIKVAILGDTATQFLATAIKGLGIKGGFFIELFEADYNQIERQIIDPTSELHNFNPEYVIIFQSSHKLLNTYNKLSSDEERIQLASRRLELVKDICNQIKCKVIYYNYPEIDDSVFGNYSNKIKSSFVYQIRRLNYELMNLTETYPNLFICDISSIQNKFGRNQIFASPIYITTEMVLSLDIIPHIASRTIDIISAIQGKAKKCLILDLDNTLWGGVIGDDGLENIQLSHELGIGKAFAEFQYWVKKLKDRGIILAVCSKNDENVAKEAFEKHPDMVLKLSDISVFVANWNNKVDNIRYIQSILNIGFDSMVFVDDNPFERNIVRENIPEVVVPELPEDPADYLEYLYGLNLFETVSYASEDVERTKLYQEESKRVLAQNSFTNISDYLADLNMLSDVSALNKFNIPRVAQLSQRSNQFNLRTIRYTESELIDISQNENYASFTFTLEDKFGNNGLISVVLLEKQEDRTLFINTWFMSCRVLKRGMENFILNTLVEYAKTCGFESIVGEYIPTPKNKIVENHYTDLGFNRMNNSENKFILNINGYKPVISFIKLNNQNRDGQNI